MNRSFYCDDRTTVEIKSGKVRGCYHNGVYYFRGIPYAEAERYMPPKPVTPWEGVRDAVTYGHVCPTLEKPDCAGVKALTSEPLFGYRFRPENEVCQYINVWTNDISGKSAKKPVMVWIHGGGYSAGSSVEQLSYEGENQARYNDVVMVSMNHRLNILGFLDLSDYGEKYKYSGNVGLSDVIMALQWVQENIEFFGGDPNNVTIFGQSGGGGKILSLLQMPAADNLYHKCIIQSGIGGYRGDAKRVADTKAIAAALVEKLGLTKETIDDIQKFTYDELRDAYFEIVPGLVEQGVNASFEPNPDGEYLIGNYIEKGFTEKANNTPILCGSTAAEFCLYVPEYMGYDLPEEEKLALLKKKYGDNIDDLLARFHEAYPDKDLMHLYHMDSGFRAPTYQFMDMRAETAKAPTWNYLLDYDFNFRGTTPAFHGAELPMVFGNMDLVDAFAEPDAYALGLKMFAAWAAFAHTGDPNVPELPKWEPSTGDDFKVMVFSRNCKVRGDFDRALVAEHKKFAPPLMPPAPKK